MKVKANKTIGNYITEGSVYDVVGECNRQYNIKQDCGVLGGVHVSHFTIIPDTPQIEVGSEWVSSSGSELKVNYVGVNAVVCTWTENGREFTSSIKKHVKFYKPKPKTVTMYFYYDNGGALLASSHMPRIYLTAFTREIEL